MLLAYNPNPGSYSDSGVIVTSGELGGTQNGQDGGNGGSGELITAP